MLNQVILVGRMVDEPTIIKNEDKEVAYVTLAVPRSYKNAEGIYEIDFVKCTLWNVISSSVTEYCRKGDLVGIRGRIQTNKTENEYVMEIVADKVTFLQSSKKETEETPSSN